MEEAAMRLEQVVHWLILSSHLRIRPWLALQCFALLEGCSDLENMPYQFFAGNQSRPLSSPSPLTRPVNWPPIHPPPIKPPQVAVGTRVNQESFTPYPHTISAGYATAHPNVTIETVNREHISSLKQVTGLLLPIRYPNSFYDAIIADPVIASVTRVAVYHDHPIATVPNSGSIPCSERVIGGIRCRLERQDPANQIHGREATNLYIQTLHLLSPYRGQGVATALLHSLLFAMPALSDSRSRVSALVKHYNIRSVTAHVHEANEDGLRWYAARGFKIQDGVVENYYRRLKPSGAKVVRLEVEWEEEDDERRDNSSTGGLENEDWEKVELYDGKDGDYVVHSLSEPRLLEQKFPSRKRKADEENEDSSQRM